ncbi:hypothetical protein JCM11641_000653 [Rhodosporidiobolus odoratus]
MNDDLKLLLKHYSSLSPSSAALVPSPPFPSPTNLSQPKTQQWLVDHLLQSDRWREDDQEGARSWRKVFWKRVVKGIEDGLEARRDAGDEAVDDEEVHPEILETMIEFLSASFRDSPATSTRIYYWGPLQDTPGTWQSVKTKEEKRMISEGTTGLRTWQACIALSNHLLATPSVLDECTRILELGAGVGLLSLVTAKLLEAGREGREEGRIVATDVDSRVLAMLEENIELNNLNRIALPAQLDWELASDVSAGREELERWGEAMFGDGGRPDLVLGADIVYDPSLASHLAAVLSWLLRPRYPQPPGEAYKPGEAFIAGTIRNESTWELFLTECRAPVLLIESSSSSELTAVIVCAGSRKLSIRPVELEVPEGGSGIVGAEGWEGEGEVRLHFSPPTMSSWLSLLEYLPAFRKGFLSVLMVAGVADMVASIVLLAYQLVMTEAFQHVVPAIVVTSFLCAAFPVWFLVSRPYSIKLPLSPNLSGEPRVGSTRDKVAKFSRSIVAEIICLGGTGTWVLIAVSTLHAETPGLVDHCGGWTICRLLLCVLALTWITFLFLCLSFASLLVSTLYFTIRRSSPMPLFSTSFAAVDWERYSGRPVNRANTVKVARRTKREGQPERTREDSEAPVLSRSVLGASVISTSTSGPGGPLNWDLQSTFTAPTLPYGGGGSRPVSVATEGSGLGISAGPGLSIAELAEMEKKLHEQSKTAPGDSVFVLIEEDKDEVEEKKGLAL